MPTHREIVEDMPMCIRALPRDARGYPVPWFVPWRKGMPDFRYMEEGKKERALKYGICWICGQQLEPRYAFVVGPMCAINRTSAEPPSHLICARYAAKACPFLARPKMQRPSGDSKIVVGDDALEMMGGRPDVTVSSSMPGIALMRNPGVALVWLTNNAEWRTRVNLLHMGDPIRTWWYAHGRKATRAEAEESIKTGLPALTELAEQDGPEALAELSRRVEELDALLPEE